MPLWAKFFFQLVFAGTAATIVSARWPSASSSAPSCSSALCWSAVIYPVSGHWIWGGGWLATPAGLPRLRRLDVSTRSAAGRPWRVLMLGPRIGKYSTDGTVNPIRATAWRSRPSACFVLWFGWFGFNPGSTMAGRSGAWRHIVRDTTNTRPRRAAIAASIIAWLLLGKPDLAMTLNGCLAGLVAITAPCAFVINPRARDHHRANRRGAGRGLSVLFFDKIKIDDPVGATSVHWSAASSARWRSASFAQDQFSPNTTGNGLFFGGGLKLLIAQLVGVIAAGNLRPDRLHHLLGNLKADIGHAGVGGRRDRGPRHR